VVYGYVRRVLVFTQNFRIEQQDLSNALQPIITGLLKIAMLCATVFPSTFVLGSVLLRRMRTAAAKASCVTIL